MKYVPDAPLTKIARDTLTLVEGDLDRLKASLRDQGRHLTDDEHLMIKNGRALVGAAELLLCAAEAKQRKAEGEKA